MPKNLYARYFKRALDVCLSGLALMALSPLFAVLALAVRLCIGSPIFFTQLRPGKKDKQGRETIFRLIKFRTMTNKRDANGRLLPDHLRMTRFGQFLRSTSLDELPELINIFKGDMSLIGPRPQLVQDMLFMTADERRRHDVTPGLSGLAQVMGRNAIKWEDRLMWDLKYVERITFWGDARILLKTLSSIVRREGITEDNKPTSTNLGDYRLEEGLISQADYDSALREEARLLAQYQK